MRMLNKTTKKGHFSKNDIFSFFVKQRVDKLAKNHHTCYNYY